jgi:hypothetical protein
LLIACSVPATAQYFGRNKVQYEDFEFRVLATPHFDIYYYESEAEAAAHAARMAERWYAQLSEALDHQLSARTPIVLYASHAHFTETTVAPGLLPEGVGGFTDHQKGRVVLPFRSSLRETDHVLGHELVHAFQRDILQQAGRSLGLLPLWFVEGMAEHLSVGSIDAHTAMWIRDAVLAGKLPTLAQLGDPRWFPYRYGQALWWFLASTFGDDIAARAIRSRAPGGAVGRLVATTGTSAEALSRDWHAAMRAMYAGLTHPASTSNALVDRRNGGRLNLAPALSPDGRYLVFLSERDRYSVDVFLADGQTGQIIKKLVGSAGNADFDSLQFIESAGAWNAAGTRFALAALRHGRPVLTILDMPSGRRFKERVFDDLDQIFDPTWSPDGRQVAFTALRGGTTDLYILDLASDTVRQLTDDAFAELQPAWSPDGSTIACVTDRFTSSLDTLTFGEYRLALVEVATGAALELPSPGAAKSIDPQWVGNHLYFVADPGGVANVFRLDLERDVRPGQALGGLLQQITDVRTGVSGMTFLSPALAVAPAARRAVFSVYHEGGYEIRAVELSEGREYRPGTAAPTALARSMLAAPDGSQFRLKPYQRGLALNRVTQPYVTAGGGALGGFFRAGVSFSFSDLLEQQQVQTAVQVGTRLRDLAFQTAYVNRRARWTWGVVGGQLPISFGRAYQVPGTEGDLHSDAIVRETTTFVQTHRQAGFLAAYPFSRSRRAELTAGFHRISFAREVNRRRYSSVTGSLLDEDVRASPVARSASLFETALALVHDTSVHGPTGPVLGGRSRIEVAPTVGDLSFVTVNADHRRYFMPLRPLTIAVRVQHIGRYGPGAGDPRLLPLLWTLRDLVRGYAARDAAVDTCSTPASCGVFGEFTARRFAVSNIEVRLPLVGPLGRVSRSGGLPIDALAFFDMGAFWSRPTTTNSTVTLRTLRSAGAGVRLNAAGFVFEFTAVRPFDRQPSGWRFGVNFRPAF